MTLVDRAVVHRVLVDGNGRATGVEYLRWNPGTGPATPGTASADVVVLAAHAVENARLPVVSLDYQLYFAQYAFGGGITQEIEFNIIAHPTAEAHRLPRLSYEEYAHGVDQTRLLGIARVHVLCDNPLAIDAGRRLFAEPKHPGWFETTMPSPNGPAGDAWTVHCRKASAADDGSNTVIRHDADILTLTADLTGLRSVPANNAPVTGYGTDGEGRALAGR
ncbi:hypothetical protein ACWFR1_30440 [Streptomyces sp. NPDC055103]